MKPPVPFDAVLFDLDGTLVATDRFWVAAARAGAHRAFSELGLTRAIPSAAEWMSLVGYPLRSGLRQLFPDLEERALDHLQACCEAEEESQLRAGGAALLPGAAETLAELRGMGVRLGVASNCSRGYLERMMDTLGLARWIEEARCLDSPGVSNKADMLRDLLRTFGTRSAVFVGDRRGDGESAVENAIPRVHYAGAFAEPSDAQPSDAIIGHLGELLPLLERRSDWIRGALQTVGISAATRPRSLGVSGPSASGKTLWARDAARLLAALDIPARVVALEDFLRSPDKASTGLSDRLGQTYDLEQLGSAVLEPHARGERVRVRRKQGKRLVEIRVEPDDLLVLEGPYLLDPRLRGKLDKLIYLEAADEVCLRRIAGRDVPHEGPDALIRARRSLLPAQRELEQRCEPRRIADLVLDASSVLGRAEPVHGAS